jgi:micrococcal nuclease
LHTVSNTPAHIPSVTTPWRHKAIVLIAICVISMSVNSQNIYKESWPAVVTHVSDGDTLWVQPAAGGQALKLRLDGVDAPEICQSHGPQALAALKHKVWRKKVQVHVRTRDAYGRSVARVDLVGMPPAQADVGAWMVTQGHAWAHRYQKRKAAYAVLEDTARRQRKGLFAADKPQHPSHFRKSHGTCRGTSR